MFSYRGKLQRAATHLKELNRVWAAFLKTNPYRHVREQHFTDDFIEVVLHAEAVGEIPPEISLIVGDAVYCLRSALDHLAHQLAATYTPPKSFKPERVQFPIHSAPGSYMVSGVWAVSQMSPEAQGRIEKMQPYHGWPGTQEHPLGVLNKLSNIDKHRHLTFTNSISTATTAIIDEETTRDAVAVVEGSKVRFGTFKNETEIAHLIAQVTGPDPYVNVKAYIQIDPAFPESGPAAGEVVVNELIRILKHIRLEVIYKLEDLL